MLFCRFRRKKKKKNQLLCELDSLSEGSECGRGVREGGHACGWSWRRLLSPLVLVVTNMMLAELPVKGYPVFNDRVTKPGPSARGEVVMRLFLLSHV